MVLEALIHDVCISVGHRLGGSKKAQQDRSLLLYQQFEDKEPGTDMVVSW